MQSLRALDEVELHLGARALAAAFREYASLNEEIAINRIDVAPDGQTATVKAVLAITQVVKIGRAAPRDQERRSRPAPSGRPVAD